MRGARAVIAVSLVAIVLATACAAPHERQVRFVATDTAPISTAPRARAATERVVVPAVVTLADCIRIALANHASAGVAASDTAIAESRVQEAASAYWPQVNLKSTAVRLDEDPSFIFEGAPLDLGAGTRPLADAIALAQLVNAGFRPDPGNAVFQQAYEVARQQALQGLRTTSTPDINVRLLDRDSWTTALEVGYPLYTGGKITALNERARIGSDVARSRERANDEDITLAVTKLYFANVLTRELVALGESTLMRFEVIRDITERVYQTGSGTVSKTDYLKVKVITSTVDGQLHALRRHRELARTGLANAMGLAPSHAFDLADVELTVPTVVLDEDAALDDAFSHRADWEQVHLGIEAAGHEIDEESSAKLPTVVAFAQAQHLENGFEKGFSEFAEDSWTVGLQVDLNVFDGFATDARTQRARAGRSRLKHLRRLLEEGIRAQVRAQIVHVQAAQAEVTSAEQGIADASENTDLNLRAYEIELVETQDVVEAQLLETITRARFVKARHDLNAALAELNFASGTILRDSGAER